MTDFAQIEYLNNGSPVQIRAFAVLTQHKILDLLSEFAPVLIGTVPIDIAIASSDLDIACYWTDPNEFIKAVRVFGKYEDFSIEEKTISRIKTIIACFKADGFEIEIFGQNVPVAQQNGYRHMIIEHLVLQQKEEDFRQQIISLKEQGYKTEPAFAQLLGLEGDPYEALLDFGNSL